MVEAPLVVSAANSPSLCSVFEHNDSPSPGIGRYGDGVCLPQPPLSLGRYMIHSWCSPSASTINVQQADGIAAPAAGPAAGAGTPADSRQV